MKRKAAARRTTGQPANKMSSSKGKQVAGTPVDTDQETEQVLRATPLSQKVCMFKICSLAWPYCYWHEILWRMLSCLPLPSSVAMPVKYHVPRNLLVQAVMQSMQCCAVLTDFLRAGHDATARQIWPAPAQGVCCPVE